MTDLTPQTVAALAEKATPGPWVASDPDPFGDVSIAGTKDDPLVIAVCVNSAWRAMGGLSGEQDANAALIAAAPSMAALIAAQAAEIERLRGALVSIGEAELMAFDAAVHASKADALEGLLQIIRQMAKEALEGTKP